MKTILITGANSGLGFETAKQFIQLGCHVILASRTMEKSDEAKHKIHKKYSSSKVTAMELELSAISNIQDFVSELQIPVNVLICNAGIGSTKATEYSMDGIEKIFAVNHLAHYALSVSLVNKFPKDLENILVVSSNAHNPDTSKGFFPEPKFSDLKQLAYPNNNIDDWKTESSRRYVHSKLCNVMFVCGMADRLPKNSITKVNAYNPGFLPATSLGRNEPVLTRFLLKYVLPQMRLFMKEMRTVKQSAEMLSHIALNTKENSKYYDGNALSDSSELSRQQRWIDELWLLSEELTNIKLDVKSLGDL
jgi:NAD(P)-dependent dehydrogenase (short-subunit alcohol dehydrogenase family)